MTNNLEDFDQPELDSGGEPPSSGGIKANLSHAWRTRPLFKLLVLMVVVGAIIAVSINLFSPKPLGEQSKLASPPSGLHQPPGGPASPYFNQQTMEAEKERETNALKTGGSALPTPIGQTKSIEEMTEPEKPKIDPLVELRSQIEHQKQEIAQMKQQQQAPTQAPRQQQQEAFDDSLAQAMQKEMQKLTGEWDPKGITDVGVSRNEDLGDENGRKSARESSASDNDSSSSYSSAGKTHAPIVPAGTVNYAVMLTEANSDVPGPILAQIVSGPLAGARAIGEFKVTQDPYLIMKFTLATLKGKEYRINAIALDPDTTLGGMATEVDERYLTRVLLPAAAGFLQGFGSALGQGSSSVVTNGTSTIVQQSGQGLQQGAFQGLAQVGQTLGQFLENQANQTQPLVRVATGTPFGLFFIESVCSYFTCPGPSPDEDSNPHAAAANTTSGNPAGYNTTMFGNPGQMPNGMNASLPYPTNSNVPYPNANMPYNARSLTNPNSGIASYNGSSYVNTAPNAYGIGTPLINP